MQRVNDRTLLEFSGKFGCGDRRTRPGKTTDNDGKARGNLTESVQTKIADIGCPHKFAVCREQGKDTGNHRGKAAKTIEQTNHLRHLDHLHFSGDPKTQGGADEHGDP